MKAISEQRMTVDEAIQDPESRRRLVVCLINEVKHTRGQKEPIDEQRLHAAINDTYLYFLKHPPVGGYVNGTLMRTYAKRRLVDVVRSEKPVHDALSHVHDSISSINVDPTKGDEDDKLTFTDVTPAPKSEDIELRLDLERAFTHLGSDEKLVAHLVLANGLNYREAKDYFQKHGKAVSHMWVGRKVHSASATLRDYLRDYSHSADGRSPLRPDMQPGRTNSNVTDLALDAY